MCWLEGLLQAYPLATGLSTGTVSLDLNLRHQSVSSTSDTSRRLQHTGMKLSPSTPLRSLSRSQKGTSAVGDSVKEDEVVCEIETDKTSLQVPSPAAGVITELLVPDGGRVEAGNPLFKLKKGGNPLPLLSLSSN
ncbi:unnamed protein product [Oncorhynchus mykiss]|uniref:Lipoyl-binding domain-containing protein n=1 Tax=Oncorhynchus mykiss TaxID=8022 RepID=A0A060Z5A6_ONCMY|nr:unnamed protein product [Oncorhynchus mykiss]